MQNIILTKKQVDNLSLLSGSNTGTYGRCYEYKGKVLKIFKQDIAPTDYQNIKANLKRKSDIIMYPESKVYLYDEKLCFKGYLSDKAPGIDLSSIRPLIRDGKEDISFDNFLKEYYDIFLPKLKQEDVILNDIKLEHIFFRDFFCLIDTDWYVQRPSDMLVKEKDEKNIGKINTYLGNFIFNFVPIEVCNDLTFDISLQEKYSEIYIEKIFEGIVKTTNNEVNTFNELLNYKYRDNCDEPVLYDKDNYYLARKRGWI